MLYEIDTGRLQQFREIEMDQAGGTKGFTEHVYAGAFNYLAPTDIRQAICSAPWRYPDEVIVIEESVDYDIRLHALSVTQLRTQEEKQR